ncbi:MAG: cadmium-translocating P-type ATPase [Gemmatimonadetes bacterium]|nr:cadmium-translocating P-type ATPase [Gemmatimonadota bacterium]
MAPIAYGSMALFAIGLGLRFWAPESWGFSLFGRGIGAGDAVLVASALVGGWNFFPRGLRAARDLALDMNFLMTIAILGAVAVGETVEGAAIAFLFAISELLETFAVDRARGSVAALLDLAPQRAVRLREDGREEVVAVDDLRPGDRFVVRPGDRVAVDAVVVEGHSAVDESAVTGESLPVEKGVGAGVLSGTINREGWIVAEARHSAENSTLARIVRLVEEAESRKTRTEHFVERFARVYTPVVTAAAVLVVVVPVVLFGAPFTEWFVRGLTLLVIACPCALVISTPVAVVSGLTAAARNGVLIKGGRYLEALGDVRAIALDKTGTLTFGHPEVVAMTPGDSDDALALAAALESRSEHPLARAIVEFADRSGVAGSGTVVDFEAVPGRGARGSIEGRAYRIGKPEWLAEHLPGTTVPEDATRPGATVVGLASSDRVLAWFTLADTARADVGEAIAELRSLGVHQVTMLTGDRSDAAAGIAAAAGVDEVRAELLPADKVAAIEALQDRFGGVAMVGDGVNDAPALAAATVGIAMGARGSDVALETADVALMGDDLRRLPYLWRMSKRARRVIRQNIAAALLVKAGLALAVPFGWVSLVTAVVVGDMGVSLAVTLNALRLGSVRD